MRNDLVDISYIGRVIADFVLNFVAMATEVGLSRICLASFNSPTPKTHVIHKDLWDISYIGRVMADFVPNFVAMATEVGRSKIYTQRSRGYFICRPSYGRFCPKFCCHGNGGSSQ